MRYVKCRGFWCIERNQPLQRLTSECNQICYEFTNFFHPLKHKCSSSQFCCFTSEFNVSPIMWNGNVIPENDLVKEIIVNKRTVHISRHKKIGSLVIGASLYFLHGHSVLLFRSSIGTIDCITLRWNKWPF